LITAYTQSATSPVSFKLSFTSNATPPISFRIFVGGVLKKSFTSNAQSASTNITVGAGSSPYIEVLDDDTMIPHPAFPSTFTLAWRQWQGAASYVVQVQNGLSWTTLMTIPDNPNTENYSYTTAALDDETSYTFQVIPEDAAGNQGTPLSFPMTEVRAPDVPSVGYTWASNVLTIAAS
jgi:hypothetical protein